MSAVVATRVALSQQLIRFSIVGLASTVVNLALFATLVRGGMSNQVANGASLVISTVANTAVNRLWNFEVSGREHLGPITVRRC